MVAKKQTKILQTLNDAWFQKRLKATISAAGNKYFPNLHIQLPISELFDGLVQSPKFYERLEMFQQKIIKDYQDSLPGNKKINNIKKTKNFQSLQKKIQLLLRLFKDLKNPGRDRINFDAIIRNAERSQKSVWKCTKILELLDEKEKQRLQNSSDKLLKHSTGRLAQVDYYREKRALYDLADLLGELIEFSHSAEAKLFNNPAFLLFGNAGAGKTHLLCSVAEQRTKKLLPTVLILGERFGNGDIWTQFLQILNLSCTKEDFLSALNLLAKSKHERALIMIDALNEGENLQLFRKQLLNFISDITKYPFLGIAISIRTGLEALVLPHSYKKFLISKEHRGFELKEWEAARMYFKEFDIRQPEVPLLYPEFRIPLFLRLFCEAFRGFHKLPKGHFGATFLFENYIKRLDEKISKEVGYAKGKKILWNTIKSIAEYMGQEGKDRIIDGEIAKIISKNIPGNEKKMLQAMENHFLLTKFPSFNEAGQNNGYVYRFPYQKFSDHLVVRYLLNNHLDPKNPRDSFLPTKPLGKILCDETHASINYNLVEALLIQVPERLKGTELMSVAPYCANFEPIQRGFVESLIWRDPEVITDEALNYANKYIRRHRSTRYEFLNALLTVATNKDHPYNARFLHNNLMKLKLPIRDERWSIFLHYQYGERAAVDRLVDWAWHAAGSGPVDDEIAELAGIALTWLLTTSERYLRDRTTKALVSLFTNRLQILTNVMSHFRQVNDPYVLERLYAVAYGCALRNTDGKGLQQLAAFVYREVFQDGEPPPHLLLRDYARGVVEFVLAKPSLHLKINISKLRPPYRSYWPAKIQTPSKPVISGRTHDEISEQDRSLLRLYHSVMESGDFARYIIGTNSGHFEWYNQRLNKRPSISKRKLQSNHKLDFDLAVAQRWIFQKIMNLGWTKEKFGEFDSMIASHLERDNRMSHRSERIGKKYQWIAYHEFLARASDNLVYRGDLLNRTLKNYDGPWQIRCRDIDPSFLLTETKVERWESDVTHWWLPCPYNSWNSPRNELDWLKAYKDLPSAPQLIELQDPEDKTVWLLLSADYLWREPPLHKDDKWKHPRREIWYKIRSFIVKDSDSDELFQWASQQNFARVSMDISHLSEVFFGELYWSPAFEFFQAPNHGQYGWSCDWLRGAPKEVLASSGEYFLSDANDDCSIDRPINIKIPAKFIAQKMQLDWRGVEGCFFDRNGTLIIFDPSINAKCPGALLVKKDAFVNFLRKNHCNILWTQSGEKQIIGGDLSKEDFLGRLEITGAFTLSKGNLKGKTNPRFFSSKQYDKENSQRLKSYNRVPRTLDIQQRF